MARRSITTVLPLIAAALVASPAFAQTSLQPATTTTDDIVVMGNRVEELATAYTGAVAVPAPSEDQLARWNDRLCPGVVGLAAADAQTLVDHIARRAHEVGLGVEQSGCTPNLVIIFTPDSDATARHIFETRKDLLGYYADDDMVTAGRDALDEFVNTPRSVRWWHVANTVSADGRALGDTRSRGGRSTANAVAASQGNASGAATMGSGLSGVEAVRSQGSRFRRSTRQDLNYVLVVVDSRRIVSMPSGAIADYLSMAALVQLDPHADMRGFPTILNLFADRAAGVQSPAGMTEWDRLYLQGLYGATREAANSRQQRGEIVRRIVEGISAE